MNNRTWFLKEDTYCDCSEETDILLAIKAAINNTEISSLICKTILILIFN